MNLRRGDMVRATGRIPLWVANVPEGMLGVCFEEADAYGDGNGPMVRWFNGRACNVHRDFFTTVDPRTVDEWTLD